MQFNITHEGRTTLSVSVAGALDLGYPQAAVAAAAKARARVLIAKAADGYRSQLVGASPLKVAGEYKIKAAIAADPASASSATLDLLDREATARGKTREELLAEIAAKAAAFEEVALLVGAIEAEAKAAIDAIDDAAEDLEDQVAATLAAAQTEAEGALAAALVLIEGEPAPEPGV